MLGLSGQNNQSNSHYHYWVYIFAGVVSLLLSAWINIRESVINPDAICYLLSAQAIGEGGIRAGMDFCPQAQWPFYSFLIAMVVNVTHVSYQFAAYAIDSIFTLITVISFLALVKSLGASKRILWLAAAVILLSHEFNYVRQYIVRDHGFWAFYMLSMYFMVQLFASSPRKMLNAFAWSISLAIATLFRIEGAMFLLLLPFAAFFLTSTSWLNRGKVFLQMNALTMLTGGVLLTWLMVHPESTMSKLGRTHEVFDQLQSGLHIIADRYQTMRAAMLQHVLTLEAARDASLVLILTLFCWYMVNVLGNLSWIYSALVLYAWGSRAAQIARPALIVLVAYLLANLLITSTFFVQHLFLAKRYLIAFTLTLMIWVPYALNRLIEQSALLTRYRAALYASIVLVLISAVGGIFDFGYSKVYLRQAGSWIASNVPANAKLYMNDAQLMYYSEHNRDVFFSMIKKPLGNTKQYDYIALRLRHDEAKQLSLPTIAEFSNKRGDRVLIYKIR